ncbi:Hypothetical protein P9211_14381 [Prochlorococcus marinus str. MIT 9211]|uniref:Uncharacterized protein n=1 Tax=Prochlorococcus marinus (strain MIT 9211) TaxID=93059 RepID=A9BC07_PROM4|nr:Hypothetical protein P9211_14381 [Prochlorococcus marinus str. MIT 9211]
MDTENKEKFKKYRTPCPDLMMCDKLNFIKLISPKLFKLFATKKNIKPSEELKGSYSR